jgi:hypothetical protein
MPSVQESAQRAETKERKKEISTHIQRIVIPEDVLELGRKVAAGAGHEAEKDRGGWEASSVNCADMGRRGRE